MTDNFDTMSETNLKARKKALEKIRELIETEKDEIDIKIDETNKTIETYQEIMNTYKTIKKERTQMYWIAILEFIISNILIRIIDNISGISSLQFVAHLNDTFAIIKPDLISMSIPITALLSYTSSYLLYLRTTKDERKKIKNINIEKLEIAWEKRLDNHKEQENEKITIEIKEKDINDQLVLIEEKLKTFEEDPELNKMINTIIESQAKDDENQLSNHKNKIMSKRKELFSSTE